MRNIIDEIILSIGSGLMCVSIAFLAWYLKRTRKRPYNECLASLIEDVSYRGLSDQWRRF